MEASRKILIVDDTAMFRELESLFLSRAGRIYSAQDAAEGLSLARQEEPDVIIADLSMPGMDGDALCRLVRSDPVIRQTPVILVTSGEDADDRARAIHAGADDVISKPISRISLIEAVNRFLRQPMVRGLKRVILDSRVHVTGPGKDVWSEARNLSRGGIFLEGGQTLEPETEVSIEFKLPSMPKPIASTAKVVWRREQPENGRSGMGLQFLALDRTGSERIDQFVYERVPLPSVGAFPTSETGTSPRS